jgi:hypothetical protein
MSGLVRQVHPLPHTREGREREGAWRDWVRVQTPHHTKQKAESEKVRWTGWLGASPSHHTREAAESERYGGLARPDPHQHVHSCRD